MTIWTKNSLCQIGTGGAALNTIKCFKKMTSMWHVTRRHWGQSILSFSGKTKLELCPYPYLLTEFRFKMSCICRYQIFQTEKNRPIGHMSHEIKLNFARLQSWGRVNFKNCKTWKKKNSRIVSMCVGSPLLIKPPQFVLDFSFSSTQIQSLEFQTCQLPKLDTSTTNFGTLSFVVLRGDLHFENRFFSFEIVKNVLDFSKLENSPNETEESRHFFGLWHDSKLKSQAEKKIKIDWPQC